MAKLIILEPAQRELEEIAILHMNLVGPNSARKITNLILDTLSRLELFPLSGPLPEDRELLKNGYRYVIAGKYICIYRQIADIVYVYHIAMVQATIRSYSSDFCMKNLLPTNNFSHPHNVWMGFFV